MTPRQRYLDTLLFRNPDRVPLHLDLARESTLAQWAKEGLPQDRDYRELLLDTLGIDGEALLRRHIFEASFKMIPEYEQVILEHRDGHYVIRDWQGAVVEISDRFDESYLRTKTDFVTRRWHKFPVETREDWAEMKKRYDPADPCRLPANFEQRCRELRGRAGIEMLRVNGVFWQLREWCGLENLSVMMIQEPDFVSEMAGFWGDFVLEVLKRFVPAVEPDSCFICEDMAYKAHCMISPAMTRRFIQPAYLRWIPFLKANGCPVIEMDSDGCLDELIPIWIEAGANCCSPIEVAAHCDLVDYRRRYGTAMAYLQGLDKRKMARGGREMEQHVMGIVPALLRNGGYIPGCDHGVPADVSWSNYVEFSRMLARLCGWL